MPYLPYPRYATEFAAMLAVSLQLCVKEIGKLAANICYNALLRKGMHKLQSTYTCVHIIKIFLLDQ